MGFVQRFLHHDFAASRDEFQQAVDLRPNDSDALLNLAVADSNLGNLDAAIKAMRRAIALDPQESGYHYLLGMMLAAAGCKIDAGTTTITNVSIDGKAQNVMRSYRSEARRVGKEGVRTCRSRGAPCH